MTEGRFMTTALRRFLIAAVASSLVLAAIAPFPCQVQSDLMEIAYDEGAVVGVVAICVSPVR